MSKVKSPLGKGDNQIVPKPYPSVKTIILREEDEKSRKDLVNPTNGVWQYNLTDGITLKDGDEVVIKSSFVDISGSSSGLITITPEEIEQLSLTTGLYWQDSGEGVDIQRFASSTDAGVPTYDPGLGYNPNGPLPLCSQVLQSEGTITTPNGRNYICQNTLDNFTNTRMSLDLASVFQSANGAVATLGAITTGGTGYTTANGLSVVDPGATPGSGLRVDIVATPIVPGTGGAPDTGGVITSITINTEFSQGEGYIVGSVIRPSQPNSSGGGLNQSAETTVATIRSPSVPMSIEFQPNENYDPALPTHEYFDYVMVNAENPSTANVPANYSPPPAAVQSRLESVANISQLNVQTDPDDSSLMYVYSALFSNPTTGFPVTGSPNLTTNHIATIVSRLDQDNPVYDVIRNEDWDGDANLAGNDPKYGWWFQVPVGQPNVIFNPGVQSSFYRICLGVWLWVWDPGPKASGQTRHSTFPEISTKGGGFRHTNNYQINLQYYSPTVDSDGKIVSKMQNQPKQWAMAPDRTIDGGNVINFFAKQFPNFVDYPRGGVPEEGPTPKSGIPAPLSQFPQPPPAKNIHEDAYYPRSNSGGTCYPCFFGDMKDTSSNNAGVKKTPTWAPFLYDVNPGLTNGGIDADAKNFQPFRFTDDGDHWQGGRREMKDYPFAGVVCQDARGCINDTGAGEKGIKFPSPIPAVWTAGPYHRVTTVVPPPPFKFTHSCVYSKPYIPSANKHMAARQYTTVLKDIQGDNVNEGVTTLRAGTFTYAEWARILTDTLNRVPPRRTPANGVGFNGQSNDPTNPFHPLNVPTYTSTRFLTDTVELGYQGEQFPSNRVGLSWSAGYDACVGIVDETGTQISTTKSVQPYWMSESAGAIFRWADGDPQPTSQTNSALNATVDPLVVGTTQTTNVYGINGPKFAGAESVSIIFNEESQAFEIVQMHSNLYDATSGAIITKQFQSGFKNQPYPRELGEMSITDQSGGIFITDWQPRSVWHDKMNMSPNTLVHTGGDFSDVVNGNVNSFADESRYPGLGQIAANPVALTKGVNITGNFRSTSGLIDKRVNIPSAPEASKASFYIGGNYASPDPRFDLQVETNTPVTILGNTIIPTQLKDPFFMVELTGVNRNEVYGLQTENKLISQLVGRYFVAGAYIQGDEAGSITYTHRGEPIMLSELGVRILDSEGQQLAADVLNSASAVVIEINSEDISLIEAPATKK